MLKNQKAIGIIGGMGPFASLKMYESLLVMARDNFNAVDDESFPEIVIDSVPVPDFISNTQTLRIVRKELINRVKKLNQMGVGVIGMTCNTAHLLYEDLSEVSKAEFPSMIELVTERAKKLGFKKVGILATPTTVNSGLYGRAMNSAGINVIYPNKASQNLIEKIIREAVRGERDKKLIKKLENLSRRMLIEDDVDGLVLGCTELPLVFPKGNFKGKVIDSIEVLAMELLVRYYKKV